MDVFHSSRRALLQTLAAAPVAASTLALRPPWAEALSGLHQSYGDTPVTLARTPEGRDLSAFRYERAVEFLPDLPEHPRAFRYFLYSAGITAQLGIAAHLLDVGFPDDWCARHIGHRVAHSLSYANATGFGHDCPNMTRLAEVLTPYWKWNSIRLFGEEAPDDGGFQAAEVRKLIVVLLAHVRRVTGHEPSSRWLDVADAQEAGL